MVAQATNEALTLNLLPCWKSEPRSPSTEAAAAGLPVLVASTKEKMDSSSNAPKGKKANMVDTEDHPAPAQIPMFLHTIPCSMEAIKLLTSIV